MDHHRPVVIHLKDIEVPIIDEVVNKFVDGSLDARLKTGRIRTPSLPCQHVEQKQERNAPVVQMHLVAAALTVGSMIHCGLGDRREGSAGVAHEGLVLLYLLHSRGALHRNDEYGGGDGDDNEEEDGIVEGGLSAPVNVSCRHHITSIPITGEPPRVSSSASDGAPWT